MKIKDMPIEELELMSYTDLSYMLLKETKKPMNTADLFKNIINIPGLLCLQKSPV